MINNKTDLEVKKMMFGSEVGDLQIRGLIPSEEIYLVIFFRDSLAKQSHDPDIAALMKVCDVHDISLAVNLYSSEILFKDNIESLDIKIYSKFKYIMGGGNIVLIMPLL